MAQVERVADADGERGDVLFAFLHHVEMRVEGRRLKHLGKAELHLVGKCRKMCGRDLAILVLDQMQVLDQEIAAARTITEQHFDFMRRRRIDLTALWRCLRALTPLTGVIEFADLVDVVSH